jgi:Subtilase family/Abnormal spindle-like microcephaly-assoc'd, ASPM-SPD-2-Hydin
VRANHPDAKVVNVSLVGDIPLSGDCSRLTASLQAYAASVDALRAAGASVFAAAGNGGRTNGLPAPACFPPTVAVGAVYTRSIGSFTAPDICVDRETSADRLACFSNTSSELDLLAAGLLIAATGLGGTELSIAGTSAASAQAAGVAALLLQADPRLTPDALLGLLRETGTPVTDRRSHVLQASVPRIDAAAALARLTQHPIPLLPAPLLVPKLAVSLHRITFGRTRVHGSARRVLTIHNAGDGTVTVRVSSTSRALSVGPERLRLSGKPGAVSLVFRPTRIGRYSGRVRLATDDPSQPVVTIPFNGVATG